MNATTDIEVPALIYARLSDDPDGTAEAVEMRQLPDCRGYARDNRLRVVEEIVDNDVSASRYNRKGREGYRRLVKLVEEGQVRTIIVWHLDRMWRQPKELEHLIDLADEGRIDLRTLSGDYDLSNPDHRFMLRLGVSMAAKESDDKSRRLARKHLQLATEGKPKGGGRGFGYSDSYDIIPAEAEAIRWAYQHVMDGGSVRGIIREWNARGLTTPKGNTWQQSPVRATLIGARLAGLREHHGQVVAEATWEAIVSVDDWQRVKAILTDPSRRTNDGITVRKHPWTGFVACGKCHRLMFVGVTNKKPAFQCRKDKGGCNGTSVVMQPVVETMLDYAIARLLEAPSVADALSRPVERPSVSDAIADLSNLRDKIQRVEDDHYLGELPKAAYVRVRNQLQEQVDAITAELAVTQSHGALVGLPLNETAIRHAWETRGLDWQRAFLAFVYERVEILPAPHKGARFSRDRVLPFFRDHAVDA